MPGSHCAFSEAGAGIRTKDMTTEWDIHDQIETAWLDGEEAGIAKGEARGPTAGCFGPKPPVAGAIGP